MGSTQVQEERKRLSTVQDFIADLERVGIAVPEGLRRAVDRYAFAVNMGLDAVEAADEVSAHLRNVYKEAYEACKARSDDGLEDYYACQAGIDRKWQAINTKAVLNWNDQESFVQKVWHRWRERLSKTLFDWGKQKAKQIVPGAER